MASLDVTIDLENCVTVEDVLDEFQNFASIVTIAINNAHAAASEQEELGITAGRYAREAIEGLCDTIDALMLNVDDSN